jgi:ergothioneine biosynthesis protein EgtB
LNIEDYITQVAEFASPAKWQLAHTTWFFEEMILKKYVPDYKVFNDRYSFLFNSYYNSIGDRTFRANRGNITRPTVEEVYKYRGFVDQKMIAFLEANHNSVINDLILLGLNHEQQHQELMLTDLKFAFGHNPIFPVYRENGGLVDQKNKEIGFATIEEGVYEVGHQGDGFHFDNELGRHKVYLNEFSISKGLVTNTEYIEFINDGGYEKFEYWLDEGWSWLNENGIKSPLYWHKIKGNWNHFTMGGLQPVEDNSILAHISFYEANAFANWKGMRLPTEFEWEVASDYFDWGKRWEWTNSAYLPYPNFKRSEGAVVEYNGKFMINQMVLRGASVATSYNHSRKTYRNFFHAKFQWQFTGIRLVK